MATNHPTPTPTDYNPKAAIHAARLAVAAMPPATNQPMSILELVARLVGIVLCLGVSGVAFWIFLRIVGVL